MGKEILELDCRIQEGVNLASHVQGEIISKKFQFITSDLIRLMVSKFIKPPWKVCPPDRLIMMTDIWYMLVLIIQELDIYV